MDSRDTWPDLILNFITYYTFFGFSLYLGFGPDQPFKSGNNKIGTSEQNGLNNFPR